MRRPDKPGKYRIVPKDGEYMLTGVRLSGKRVKVPNLSHAEAVSLADKLFPSQREYPKDTAIAEVPLSTAAVDDWGVPIRVTAETVAAVNAAFNPSSNDPARPSPTAEPPKPVTPVANKDEEEKKIRRAKQAKSFMELAGVCWAAGDVWIARKITDKAGCDPVKANPKQVNDLADCARETFTDWFGDREVKPWQMMVMLTLGIPLAMLIQSPRRPKDESKEPGKLKSVP